jgi:hypothetical protein
VTEYRKIADSYETPRLEPATNDGFHAHDVSDLESVRWIDLSSIPALVSSSIRTGVKAITELVPIYVAAALYPTWRLTGLQAAC